MARRASHAGSWYESNGAELGRQLDGWLGAAGPSSHAPARAVIAPHAGLSYCGDTGAYAYKQVDPTRVKRVFMLGPSHHVYLKGCAVTAQSVYQTPLGDLTVNKDIIAELRATGHFEEMSRSTDEDEHSIELHLPYVAKVMAGQDFSIIPVLVGALDDKAEQFYGKLFAKYLCDPANLFVVSSDFCHWGSRFRYQYVDGQPGPIHESIERLDRQGMSLIEGLDPQAFAAYLKKYKNTICGRHPIAVLLQALKHSGLAGTIRFLAYSQSSKCSKPTDSSVSYASASLVISDA
eukprot:m.483509 g.483509  ORF g.483509 m.483509 type:complete len:291 (+) comp22972_c0_seq1:203-1075(+)